eukprot:SAG31_NODE_2911_length_4921_cov_2.526752_3_plen_344_part_00
MVPELEPEPEPATSLVLLTCEAFPELCPDGRALLQKLTAKLPDVEVVPRVWTRADAAWPCGLCVVRSPWDCMDDGFVAFADFVQKHPAPLENSVEWLLWSAEKGRYLVELAARGVPCVPTVLLPRHSSAKDLDKVLEKRQWARAVIKPSAGSFGQRVLQVQKGAQDKQVSALLEHRDTVLQPYVPGIHSAGELSLLFFDGHFSHAVRKRPRHGDFRVQGGKVESITPDTAVLKLATNAIARAQECCGANDTPVWCRVDLLPRASESNQVAEALAGGVRKNKSARCSSKSHGKDDAESAASVGGEWMVSEFEAVDPELYFKYDSNAVDRAAAAVARKYRALVKC